MVQKHKSTTSITLRVIFAAMGNVYFGYSLAYYGITQGTIVKQLGYAGKDYQPTLDGLINALLPIGGAIGAFYSSKMAMRFGIRKSFLICDVLGFIICFASLFLNFYTITTTRLLYGVIVGINSALDPQYVQQVSPNSLSGLLGSFCNMALLLGLTFAFILSWICLQDNPDQFVIGSDYGILGFNSWRIIFGFPAVTCLIRFIAFTLFYTQDLPSELLQRGEKEKTKVALMSVYEDIYVWEQIKELEQDLQLQGKKQITYTDLIGKVYRKRLIVGSALSLLNQWCGINAINFYAVIIFSDISKGNFTLVNILTVGDGVVSIFASLASGLLINRYGRRIMFLIGNSVCCLALTALTVLYLFLDSQKGVIDEDMLNNLIICAVFTFIIAFSMSLGPVFWIYTSEILPSKGIGLVVVVNWLSLALLAQFFPIIAKETAVYVCFGFFALVSFFGQFFIYFNVMETKKLSKTQIHNMFSFYGMPGKGESPSTDAYTNNVDSLKSFNNELLANQSLP